MSSYVFKKPKKNIRRREVEIKEDDDENIDDIETTKPIQKNGTPAKSSQMKHGLLSFGEEWNEGDDGEVFQVKKSAQSRKIRKQGMKEKKVQSESQTKKNETTTVITEEVTIKIKNPISGPVPIPTSGNILAGYEAEFADDSGDDESPHQYNQPDNVRLLLQSGRIPNATMIHAAKKRRQQAREMGAEMGISFAPILKDAPPPQEVLEDDPIEIINVAYQPPAEHEELCAMDAEQISQKLRLRVEKLSQIFSKKDIDRKMLSEQITMIYDDFEKRKSAVSDLENRFQFYQDLRGFVTDLIECLDEKLPLINSLEQRLLTMCQKRAAELISRRRQDVKDQVDEFKSPKVISGKRDDDCIRRAAEREGRRIRRSKKRDMLKTHIDGMSSDDEVTEMTAVAYRTQKDIIEADAARVFEDVVDEFTNADSILRYFSEWRKLDKTAYVEAYASSCLPKALGPIIRMDLLMWNPFNKEEEINFDDMDWIRSVMMYAAEKNETLDSLNDDPDLLLLPKLMEKVIIPKLEQIIKVQWDPLSYTETKKLTSLINALLEYPSVGINSKLLTQLLDTVIELIKNCIENDIFIPLFSKQISENNNTRFNTFFLRQFAITVKLFGNILCWHGIINDRILIDISLNSILNRYLLMAIRTLQPADALPKCALICQCLPSAWLKSENCPTELECFYHYIKQIIVKVNANQLPYLRSTVDKLCVIIKNV